MTTSTHIIPINRTVYIERSLTVIECANCAMDFGIGADFERRRREDHESFYCPNGHRQNFPQQTEAERLKEQNARLRKQAESARESEQFHRDRAAHERRSAAATRGHLTRLRNRIANGVCPCCHRSFEAVHRHITSQHPEWVAEHADAMKTGDRA